MSSPKRSGTGERTIEVLVLCGASGTGKTATLWEVGHVLRSHGVRHALVDTDELDRVWPVPETTEAMIAITRRNLRAVWSTFSGLGIRHLVLCGVMASPEQSRPWIEAAIPGAAITFVRLSAERFTREQRLRRREVGSAVDSEIAASDRSASYIQDHDQPGMPFVVTDTRTVTEVAAEALLFVDWLA